MTEQEFDPNIVKVKYPHLEMWEVEVGDVCAICGTTVKERWSGIACDCGRLWFCL